MPFTHRQSVAAMVHFFVGVAEILLLLRVVLRFFNGDPDASFINWAYTVTAPLLEPLRGVFTSTDVVNRGWVVDYVALFAMAAYAVAGYIVVSSLGRWSRK
ncbi:MAG TPA: YggT family protein [Candidatus Saccharimonadales bacterium]